MLPPRIKKEPKRERRWRSPAHLNFIRSFACCACHSEVKIEAAHVRIGSGTGIGQKPDDWRAVPLCGGSLSSGSGCHQNQHTVGERSFWKAVKLDPEALIAAFIKASPKRREIEQAMRERE
jgi:hypothetical protein